MSVSVIGLDWDNQGDGLQTLLDATFKAHKENGDVLLNLNDAAIARAEGRKDGPKKTAPRPAYKHQAFPSARYNPDGRVLYCNTPAEAHAAEADGFRAQKYEVVRVAVGDPKAEKAALEAKLRESDGKIASQNDLLQKLMEQVAALVKSTKK